MRSGIRTVLNPGLRFVVHSRAGVTGGDWGTAE
jgi:hypothetical protein